MQLKYGPIEIRNTFTFSQGGGLPPKITCTVLGGALNSTHSLGADGIDISFFCSGI